MDAVFHVYRLEQLKRQRCLNDWGDSVEPRQTPGSPEADLHCFGRNVWLGLG